ncbi:nuclear transport factor 2 family protein [Nocardia sp. NPDC052566]|uniref:nuclear transport factor 2 family protein n=1 Tax=Nocardia sp. NPDC052566 TaxID=3364330 RepID=UPI0037C89939
MTLSVQERLEIAELIAWHGHLVDAGELDRMDELCTEDVIYDLTDFGAGVLQGIPALRAAADALGDANPVGHHVTNVIVTEIDGAIVVRSKGIGVNADGTCASVVYRDVVVSTGNGWRIAHRTVTARRAPLGR